MDPAPLTASRGHAARPSAGLWRLGSVLIVACAVVAIAWSFRAGLSDSERGRSAANVGVAEDTVRLRVVGFGDPEGMTAMVLGLASPDARTVDRFAAADGVETPGGRPYVMAVKRNTGQLAGLAWVLPERELAVDPVISVSPVTTAEALVALAPGMLGRDLDATRARVDSVVNSAEFETLVAEVTGASDLRSSNPRLETALAAVLDMVASEAAPGAVGCADATGAVGERAADTCVTARRGTETVEIANGSNRWVAVFPSESVEPCALIAPRPGTAAFAVDDRCGRSIDVAAPGPLADGIGPLAHRQVAIAASLTAFVEYGLPFADLALGGSGASTPDADQAVIDEMAFVGRAFGELAESNPAAISAALILSDPDQRSDARALALLTLTRLAIARPEIPDRLIAGNADYAPNNIGASLLALYDRAALLRSGGAAPPVWDGPGWATVELAPLLARAGS